MIDFSDSRKTMVDTQVRPSDVTKFPIIDAMLNVPRENFVPVSQRDVAYRGENIELGRGRVILDPRSFAKMLDGLDIQPTEVVLDLGCAQGYSAAIIARLADFVIAVEEDKELVEEAQLRLSEFGADNVAVIVGKLSEGSAKNAPYDVMIIEGAVEIIPDALLEQLKEGGRIACIVTESNLETAKIGIKLNGVIQWQSSFNAGAPCLVDFKTPPEFLF